MPNALKGTTMTSPKPRVGEPVEKTSFASLDGEITIGEVKDRWSILFVYRGRHCPRCKKAQADRDEFGWDFDLGYAMTEAQMHSLGLYVSEPLSEAETTTNFAEPGAFAMRPDGSLMLVDISNGPAARPDLEELLDGMKFNIDKDRPVRGTA
jgi:hypothetical protein